jgi:hypothetical protein
LESRQQIQSQLLIEYIASHYEEEYIFIENMNRKSIISQKDVQYPFKPGRDVVVEGKDQNARRYLCTPWLKENKEQTATDGKINTWHWDISW